jgi:class 3 adenylate cyclase
VAKQTRRFGIHVGDVIIEDSDILGDGVNIAARLESIAQLAEIRFVKIVVLSLGEGNAMLKELTPSVS